jgi:hypothetical protein
MGSAEDDDGQGVNREGREFGVDERGRRGEEVKGREG